jgi:hypothetical protein
MEKFVPMFLSGLNRTQNQKKKVTKNSELWIMNYEIRKTRTIQLG